MTTRMSKPPRELKRPQRFFASYDAALEAVPDVQPHGPIAERRRAAAGLLRRAMYRRFLHTAGAGEMDAVETAADVPSVRAFLDHYNWRLSAAECRGPRDVSPDVLGAVLERQLDRRRSGAYYTSDDVTRYMAAATIVPALLREVQRSCPDALPAGLSPRDLVTQNVDLLRRLGELLGTTRGGRLAAALLDAVSRLRVIDPMCGAGAFLLAAADAIAKVVDVCERSRHTPCAVAPSAFGVHEERADGTRSVPATSLVHCLHGIDLMPDAIEVCRMRLSLWALARDRTTANLRFHLRVGNALAEPVAELTRDGTFDVVLGNPPYLEAREVDYEVNGFQTRSTGAVHAWCVDRGLQLLKPGGTIAMIVPMALVATQRMRVVQELIEEGRDTWYANFAWRPAKLFADVNRALTLFVAAGAEEPRTFSTGYQRWSARTRRGLMARIRYVETPRNRPHYWTPKLSHELEQGLLTKLLAIPTRLGHFQDDTPHRVYYRTTGGLYWKVFTDFPPTFSVDGKSGKSSRETSFGLARAEHVLPAIAALSSSTFWWWYTISSNLRDLNPSDIAGFPLPAGVLEDGEFARLARRYLADLQRHSRPLTRQQSQTGRTETQGFKVQKSKPILDEIDRVLARHYDLTAVEVEYLIHFDEAFRVGGRRGRTANGGRR